MPEGTADNNDCLHCCAEAHTTCSVLWKPGMAALEAFLAAGLDFLEYEAARLKGGRCKGCEGSANSNFDMGKKSSSRLSWQSVAYQ